MKTIAVFLKDVFQQNEKKIQEGDFWVTYSSSFNPVVIIDLLGIVCLISLPLDSLR